MSPERVLRNYFHAKDENRPHLLDEVFERDARLEIANRSADIQFPAVTVGREAIADVLVRRFNQTFENIYSFYLSRPIEATPQFSCDWLVGMTEKESRSVRVGCGRYDWTFADDAAHLATSLVITIEQMLVLPSSMTADVLPWLLNLDYPWTSAATIEAARSPEALASVVEYLVRKEAAS